MPVKIKVKQTGRVQKPKLDNGPLTRIGLQMVEAQKERWSRAANAQGMQAKPLSKKYFFMKRKHQGGKGRPVRDMKMTGLLIENFSLRKANEGVIRAENTSRAGRQHANQAVQYEDMIGFSGPEQLAAFRNFQAEYGQWAKRAWIQIR